MAVTDAGLRALDLDAYRVARHNDELAREASDLGYRTERATQKADGARQPVTWQKWLKQARPAPPSPSEELAVMYATAVDAISEADAMAKLVLDYAAMRDAEVAQLAKAGQTYAQIGQRLGISKQRVGQYIQAHQRRERP